MGLAQQVAFGALLAFFPALIPTGLLGLFGEETYNAIGDLIGRVAPSQVNDAIEIAKESSASNKNASALAFLVGAAAAVWASSGAMGTVMKAVNRAYDRTETRPFWRLRLLAILLVVVTGLCSPACSSSSSSEGRSARQSQTRRAWWRLHAALGASFAGRLPSPCCSSSSRSPTTRRRTHH